MADDVDPAADISLAAGVHDVLEKAEHEGSHGTWEVCTDVRGLMPIEQCLEAG